MDIEIKPDFDESENNQIIISQMDGFEFDKVRILLKTIFDYGQFPESLKFSDSLSLTKLIGKSK